ncbi:MAG TPA: hypothetical protein VFE78_08245 [Gemmataceae bacterium]|nr:hypothetical protein [Gemmataceae bacterium]
MGLFDWLFGKKAADPPPPRPAEPPPAAPLSAAPPEEENLRRWRESGEARAWVEARQGRWEHADWLALLESLRRSRYWPLRPESVGLVLEELKRDWAQRRR